MRRLFSVEVEEPEENSISPGKIVLNFHEPRIYFAYKFYDHYLSNIDKKQHARLEKIRAAETFCEMIRRELFEVMDIK